MKLILFALFVAFVAQAAPSRQVIHVGTVIVSDAAWPEPGNPRPPYDK